eukprot:855055-Amphidinium_carterae.1
MSTNVNNDKLVERILENPLEREIMTDQDDCVHADLVNGGDATDSWKRCKDCKKIVHRVHKVTGVEEHLVGVCQAEGLHHDVVVPGGSTNDATLSVPVAPKTPKKRVMSQDALTPEKSPKSCCECGSTGIWCVVLARQITYALLDVTCVI